MNAPQRITPSPIKKPQIPAQDTARASVAMTVVAYIALVIIWSTTPLAVVLSIREVDAVWMLAIRMTIAACVASGLLWLSGVPFARDTEALKTYAIGSLSMFGAMLFTYLGARHLASGMIAVLFGLSPVVVGVLSALLLPGTRLSAAQWVGMLLGLLGLAFIFLDGDKLSAANTHSVLWVLAGVFSYAVSAVWLKQRPQILSPLVQTTGGLWASAAGCTLAIPFFGGAAPDHWPALLSVAASAYSIIFGSIVAMLCYFFLLKNIAVGTIALTTLITPVFALLLGMWFNREVFQLAALGGMAMILVGLAVYYEKEVRRFF